LIVILEDSSDIICSCRLVHWYLF